MFFSWFALYDLSQTLTLFEILKFGILMILIKRNVYDFLFLPVEEKYQK